MSAEASDEFERMFADFEADLSRMLLGGVLYTPETVEAVTKLVTDQVTQQLKIEPVQPGAPIQVPGYDAIVTVTAERTDSERVFQANITISGPDARLVAREWGVEDLVEPPGEITVEIAL